MNNYRFNSIVSNSEQDALKEMIFKRARERAQAITDEVQADFTSTVQNEVMDLARNSFVASKNPFAQLQASAITEEEKEEAPEAVEEAEDTREIGFARRQVNDIKSQINYRNKTSNLEISSREVQEAMASARQDFSKNSSFVGALEFLNSQATISLIKNKGKSFEALA